MITKINKYKAVRKLSNEEFDLLTKVYEGGKHNIFEYIGNYGKYAIAAFLGYISYDYFNCADTLMGWSSAIASFLMFFGKSIGDIISSAIYSINIVKNKKYEEALNLTDMANDLRKKQIENRIEGLKQLEDEQTED